VAAMGYPDSRNREWDEIKKDSENLIRRYEEMERWQRAQGLRSEEGNETNKAAKIFL